ncbi:hypothetical protein Tco_0071790 [Tanacetum coccineum]
MSFLTSLYSSENIMDIVDIDYLTIEQYLRLTQESQTPKKIEDMTIAEYEFDHYFGPNQLDAESDFDLEDMEEEVEYMTDDEVVMSEPKEMENMKDALISIIKSIRQEMKDDIKKSPFEASTTSISDETSSIASNEVDNDDNNTSNTASCRLPKELSPGSFRLPFNIDNHSFYAITTLDAKDNIMPLKEVYAREIGNPYSRRFNEYNRVFNNEIEHLSNEYILRIGKKGYILDDVWEKCQQNYKKTNEAWKDKAYEEDEMCFICITDREDEALPLGRMNGARFKAMIRKEVEGNKTYGRSNIDTLELSPWNNNLAFVHEKTMAPPADHYDLQKWHDRRKAEFGSSSSDNGLATLVNKLDNLQRDMKKLKESVNAIQVRCQICEGPHLDKEVEQVEEFEKEEREEMGIEDEDYHPPEVQVETFEVKKYSFEGGQSFVYVSKDLDNKSTVRGNYRTTSRHIEILWSSYARAFIEVRADVELKDNIVVVMPRLVEEGLKPVTTAYRLVSTKPTGNTSGNKKNDVEPTKNVIHLACLIRLKMMWIWVPMGRTSNLVSKEPNSSGSLFWNVETSITSTTPIVDKIGKLEKLIIDGKVTLVEIG